MKRFISILLAAAMCAGSAAAAGAKDDGRILKLTIGSPTMTVDGAETGIDAEGTAPVIVNDRTLVPIRAIIEAMGGTVEWDSEARKVTLDYNGSEIELIIDSAAAHLNGGEHTLDTAPQIINGRTMLPIRFVAESFGFVVAWDGETQTVTIAEPIRQNETPVVAEVGDIKITMGDIMSYVYYVGESYVEKYFDQIKNAYAKYIYQITRYGECARAMGYGADEKEMKDSMSDTERAELAAYGISPDFLVQLFTDIQAERRLEEKELADKAKATVNEKISSVDDLKNEFINSCL